MPTLQKLSKTVFVSPSSVGRRYAKACAVEKPLEQDALGGAGAAIAELRKSALAEQDAAEAAKLGGATSGAAARACWIVDDAVLGLALAAWASSLKIQSNARRRSATLKYRKRQKQRAVAAAAIRRAWRCVLAHRDAALYRQQQKAVWHMLHDEVADAFYFQHISTGRVVWEAPAGGAAAYRPQIIDRFTDKYVLAWPQLERPKPLSLRQPREGKCMLCKIEDATRRCDTCKAPRFEAVPPSWGDGFYHFCFACFYERRARVFPAFDASCSRGPEHRRRLRGRAVSDRRRLRGLAVPNAPSTCF